MKKPKADCRADTRGGGFAGIPVCVINSPAYRDLSLWARAILVELTARMNGWNNGEIGLSVTEICASFGNSNRGKAAAAIAELMEHGFAEVTTEAVWKRNLARTFRLTFVSTGKGKFVIPATNEYLKWESAEKSGGNGALPPKASGGNGASPPAHRRGNGALPRLEAHQRKTAISEGTNPLAGGNGVSPLIVKPYPIPETPAEISHSIRTAIAETANGSDPLVAGLRAAWIELPAAKRSAVASRHAMSRDEIERVLSGRLDLTVAKLVALRSTAVSMAGSARADAA